MRAPRSLAKVGHAAGRSRPSTAKTASPRSHGLGPLAQHDSLGQRAFEAIEESIVRGTIPPGTRLFEPPLARELGVSRGLVREAIRRLEERGLLVRTPFRGVVVVELARDELIELSFIREQVEGLAARLAATRMTASELDDLDRVLGDHQRLTEGEGFTQYFQPVGDLDFHYRIVKGAKSERLFRLFTREIYYPMRLYRFKSSTRGRTRPALAEHYEIAKAIRRQDAARAEQLMRHHIAMSRETLVGTAAPAEERDVNGVRGKGRR
jgi:DNA-binding GntR family transcriptional regulator